MHKVPHEIRERIQLHTSEAIEEVQEESVCWRRMIQAESSNNKSGLEVPATHQNYFAVLSEKTTPSLILMKHNEEVTISTQNTRSLGVSQQKKTQGNKICLRGCLGLEREGSREPRVQTMGY